MSNWWTVTVRPQALPDNWDEVEYDHVMLDSEDGHLTLLKPGESEHQPGRITLTSNTVAQFILASVGYFEFFEGAIKYDAIDDNGTAVFLSITPSGCEDCAEKLEVPT